MAPAGGTRSSDLATAWWFVLLCATPWTLLLSAYGEAALAAALLSHWPRPWYDDPKALTTAPLHIVTLLLVLATWSAVPTVAAAGLINRGRWLRSSRHIAWLGVFAGGLSLLGVLVHADPGSVWYWLGD